MTGKAPTGPDRELLIARHGHASCNADRVIAGPTCTGLTERAGALAQCLADSGGVAAIHASTTPRALETAGTVGEALRVPVQEQPDLRVPDSGAAEGQIWAEARARWGTDPLNATRPLAEGGETWDTYLDRATRVLDDLLDRHPGGRLLVVGHTETVTAMYALLLGSRSLGRLKIGLDYCALSAWRATREWPGAAHADRRWTLVAHGDATHLPARA